LRLNFGKIQVYFDPSQFYWSHLRSTDNMDTNFLLDFRNLWYILDQIYWPMKMISFNINKYKNQFEGYHFENPSFLFKKLIKSKFYLLWLLCKFKTKPQTVNGFTLKKINETLAKSLSYSFKSFSFIVKINSNYLMLERN